MSPGRYFERRTGPAESVDIRGTTESISKL